MPPPARGVRPKGGRGASEHTGILSDDKLSDMDTLIPILAILAGIIGIAGSILPGLPGTPISWIGLLMLYIWGNGTNAAGDEISMRLLVVWGIVVAIVSVIDYVVPMYFTKLTGGSKYAERGALVGLIAGIILPAPPMAASLQPDTARRGAVYQLFASHPDFEPEIYEIEIFDGVNAILPVSLQLPREVM